MTVVILSISGGCLSFDKERVLGVNVSVMDGLGVSVMEWTVLSEVGSVGTSLIECGMDPAGGFIVPAVVCERVLVVVTIAVDVDCGTSITGESALVDVRMEITVETSVGDTSELMFSSGEFKVADTGNVVVATVVGTVAVTVGTADGLDAVM